MSRDKKTLTDTNYPGISRSRLGPQSRTILRMVNEAAPEPVPLESILAKVSPLYHPSRAHRTYVSDVTRMRNKRATPQGEERIRVDLGDSAEVIRLGRRRMASVNIQSLVNAGRVTRSSVNGTKFLTVGPKPLDLEAGTRLYQVLWTWDEPDGGFTSVAYVTEMTPEQADDLSERMKEEPVFHVSQIEFLHYDDVMEQTGLRHRFQPILGT